MRDFAQRATGEYHLETDLFAVRELGHALKQLEPIHRSNLLAAAAFDHSFAICAGRLGLEQTTDAIPETHANSLREPTLPTRPTASKWTRGEPC
jgi:hypothetical protein